MRFVLFVAFCLASVSLFADDLIEPSEKRAFDAQSINGERFELRPVAEGSLTVLCFLGAECPVARLYGPRLEKLFQEYSQQGVRFLGVGSNRHDSVDDLREFVNSTGLTFPMLKDYENRIADLYQAERTAEVVLLDGDLKIRYRGRIDNEFQPGVKRSQATKQELKTALQELLSGNDVTVARTEGVGCLIGRVATSEVTTDITYAKEVSRILQKHCIECHQPGEIGPFSLTDFDEVLGWAPMIAEVIDNGRMPPWNADPEHGEFKNARFMDARDKQQLQGWISGGMPFGNVADFSPATVKQSSGQDRDWPFEREPDVILPMSKHPFHVSADEFVEYQYYVVDPGFEKETWIKDAIVMPGNRAVVHHCIVFVRPPDGSDAKGIGWLTAYVPGQRALSLPDGYARRIPAGSKLVFQMHYTPTGSAEEDLTRLGLCFTEESEVTHELFTLAAINHDFEIPPHHENYPVSGSRGNLPTDGQLLAVAPHMHVRGKSFRLYAERNGTQTTLLNVPNYDFNWQHVYAFAKPLDLNTIDKLAFVSHFDNSSGNPANPDPGIHVTWGDQTFQEMAIGFFEVAVPRRQSASQSIARAEIRKGPSAKIRRAAEEHADRYFEKFDRNGDGVILREELPEAIGRFGFRNLDLNRNDKIERDEIRKAYLQRSQS